MMVALFPRVEKLTHFYKLRMGRAGDVRPASNNKTECRLEPINGYDRTDGCCAD